MRDDPKLRLIPLFILTLWLTCNVFAQGGMQPGPGRGNNSSDPTGTAFILTQTVGTLRNDFTGCVGLIFQTVGTNPTVTALGRWVVAGNSGTHTVYLYDSSYTILASASVNTSGATAGQYKYVSVTPVALPASDTYVICSAETSSGDQWYSDDTTINTITSGIGTIVQAGGNTAVPPSSPNTFNGAVGNFTYGPVNLLIP